jgi:putative FmdB family regulatory protein
VPGIIASFIARFAGPWIQSGRGAQRALFVERGGKVPLYEYQCRTNGHRFEVRHGMNEEPVTECPECGSDVRRVIHPVGVVFKGSGFYVTDSRNSGSTSKAKAPDSGAKSEKASETAGSTTSSESSTKTESTAS